MKVKTLLLVFLGLIAACGSGCDSSLTAAGNYAREVQVTFEPRNHYLDNNDNFSADDKWLVYDTR